MMLARLRVLWVLLLIGWSLAPAFAQDGTNTGVWVTTQDYCSLRAGPGTSFDRLAVLGPGITLPAIGRSVSSNWVQVEYQGQHGWLYAGWLIWSGDLISLPVDGVDPAPFVRRMLVQGVTTRETSLYRREIAPSDLAGTLPAGTVVEITGRLGSSSYRFYWYQVLYEGELYWVGAWDIRLTSGYEENVLDTAYLYSYGRLINQLKSDIADNTRALKRIEDIWLRLQAGDSVSCGYIPPYTSRKATDTDIAREPIFAPSITALDSAIASINSSTSRFSDACGRAGSEFYLTELDVNAALAELDSARRNLNVAASLLVSLQAHNPLLGEQ
jgi:uncharacterized protein YgiM (DUF1202 family)